jgi:hypothetical protein
VKATPGAKVDTTGPLLASVFIDSPGEWRAMYIFTQPLHPAHPSFLMATPSDTPNESVVSGGYAGSREEFEKLFEQFLAYLREGKKPGIGDDIEPVGTQER